LSIFTKIFVVLDMILAVALVALVVPFVLNTNTFREAYNAEVQAKVVAQANEKSMHTQIAQIQSQHATELETKEDEISRLRSQVNLKDNKINEQAATIISLQQQNTQYAGELAVLANAERQHAQINEMLQKEIKDRRDQELKLQTRNIELADKLREQTTIGSSLERTVRRLREQLTDLEAQYQEAMVQLESRPAPAEVAEAEGPLSPGIVPDKIIRGQVTDVQIIGDNVFIAVNVGLNDQVRERMKFMVHRGDQYLGDMVVTLVDQNSSAGRVTLKRGEIRAGDQVQAGGQP